MLKKIRNPWTHVPGYCCCGCCPTNEKGLRLEFYEEGDDIVSFWTPDPIYQSWRNTLHGGIQCLMHDEIGGWVVFKKFSTIGVTSKMETRYLHPVTMDGGVVELRARVTRQLRNVVFIQTELIQRGKICSTSNVTYFCSSQEKAESEYGFTGCEYEEE